MKKIIKVSLLSTMMYGSSLVASDILATVNDYNITKQEAQEFVKATAPKLDYLQLPAKQKDMILQRLIEKELFREQALKDKTDETKEFKDALDKIKRGLIVNVWMKQQLEKTVVSDSEAQDFYKKNIDKFKKPATIHARHILVKDEETAKNLIKDLKDLKDDALKAKFIELAKAKSVGPTGKKGGDLGSFSKGQMVPEFSKAAWDLKIGEITPVPVKTKFGYHVIYLEDRNDSETVPYEDVKDRIVGALQQKQFALKVSQMASELKSKAKIEMSK